MLKRNQWVWLSRKWLNVEQKGLKYNFTRHSPSVCTSVPLFGHFLWPFKFISGPYRKRSCKAKRMKLWAQSLTEPHLSHFIQRLLSMSSAVGSRSGLGNAWLAWEPRGPFVMIFHGTYWCHQADRQGSWTSGFVYLLPLWPDTVRQSSDMSVVGRIIRNTQFI